MEGILEYAKGEVTIGKQLNHLKMNSRSHYTSPVTRAVSCGYLYCLQPANVVLFLKGR
jgi:hypothetical protein